jgi:hypothetical protein
MRKCSSAVWLIGAIVLLARLCAAQDPSGSFRYLLGADCAQDSRWTSPSFDDHLWPAREYGEWPKSAYPWDGFTCARFVVSIPTETAPLALSEINKGNLGSAEEVYVNGVRVGGRGRFPSDAHAIWNGRQVVYPLAAGIIPPGSTTALVAVRLWVTPAAALRPTNDTRFVIDRADVVHTAQSGESASYLLIWLLACSFYIFAILLGAGLLLFRRISGERDLELFGYMLICTGAYILWNALTNSGYLIISQRPWDLVYGPLLFLSPFSSLFFLWRFFEIPSRLSKYLAYAGCAVMAMAAFLEYWFYSPSFLVPALQQISYGANAFYGIIAIGAYLWAMRNRPGKRVLAFALALVPAASILTTLFHIPPLPLGIITIGALPLTTLVVYIVIAGILARGAWKNWRGGSSLRKEMDAAREVQQLLVGTIPETPGFAVRAAYLPAAQVGGDFYRITPLASGGLLLIIGDVSGKGLAAAMTVSAIMGALRTIASESPGTILTLLNHALDGQLSGGFVTCCIARVNARGEARIANAGHLPPYIAGREMELPATLPLGIISGAVYNETTFQLAPGERITVLSDGVVEARDADGQFFGFERTAALSGDTADHIARTASKYGQEDDITVVTVAFLRGLV